MLTKVNISNDIQCGLKLHRSLVRIHSQPQTWWAKTEIEVQSFQVVHFKHFLLHPFDANEANSTDSQLGKHSAKILRSLMFLSRSLLLFDSGLPSVASCGFDIGIVGSKQVIETMRGFPNRCVPIWIRKNISTVKLYIRSSGCAFDVKCSNPKRSVDWTSNMFVMFNENQRQRYSEVYL